MDDVAIEREALRLFDAIADIEEDERERWIVTRTEGNSTLAARLRSLLAAERKANMRTGGAWLEQDDAPLPDRIGAYRVTGLIGRGGMGSVYRGERASGDFDHAVALKVIKPGLLSESLADRFRRERQTLAQLQHPHIAQLFDGGEMADGSPYIVMELVDGQSLLRWVEDGNPPREARLRMFGDICRAVGFAHRSLVVHRDITPSNVLVTAGGAPKLIDFGIARAPDLDASREGARPPSIGSLSLTPGYAAPERMTSASVSTGADVYSLGKLLAWLLPAEKNAEYEAILARATADDPEDRYATAEALAEDVEAWASGYPVTAAAGGRRYVFVKFVRRNRWPIAAAALALLLLISALIYALVANHRAQVARVEAETRFNDVRTLANYMLFDLNDQLGRVPGNTASRAALAEQAQRYLASLAETPGTSPALQIETARGLLRLAEIQGVPNAPNLGERTAAITSLDHADRLLAALPADDPTASILKSRSAIFRSLIAAHGEADEKAAQASIDTAGRLLAAVPRQAQSDLWFRTSARFRLAQLELADLSAKREMLGTILAQADKDRASWPSAYRGSFDGRAYDAMLDYYRALSFGETDYDKALALHIAAEKTYDALLGERRDDPLLLYRAAWNGLDGFAAGSRAGKEDQSDRLIRRASAVVDRLALIDERDDAVRALQANIKEALAQNLRDADRFDEAIAAGKEAVAARKAGAQRKGGKNLGNLGFSQMILGIIARDAGNRALACESWSEALASLRTAETAGQIVGFHKSFIPGIDAHVKACGSGAPIDFPMR